MAQDDTGRPLDKHERYRGEHPIVVEGLKNQFGEQQDHLGMVDEVLESLLHQQARKKKPALRPDDEVDS